MNLSILYITTIVILSTSTCVLFFIRKKLIQEISVLKKSKEKYKKMNDSKNKFFSIITHDLKNPFNGIMGMSEYLSSEYENVDEEERKEIINDINVASKNAFNLLLNLLEWTCAQNGSIKNNPTTILPEEIIELSLETVTTLAKSKNIELITTITTTKKGVADENLIKTVIRNLCTNAIKFSPRNSIIKIIVNEYEEKLTFCIKDEGIGLSDKEIDKLFRIDTTFQKKGTEKETGSGLGLKLCKEFVEYCKGQLWVVSNEGKGSSFYFTIPIK